MGKGLLIAFEEYLIIKINHAHCVPTYLFTLDKLITDIMLTLFLSTNMQTVNIFLVFYL